MSGNTFMGQLDPYGLLRSQWNYYGDMSFRLDDVRVRSVQLDADKLITSPADDPLIGASVYLNNALLCDNDPEGFNGTQIFSEALELRAPAALDGSGTFLSRKPTRATTRALSWYRNVSYHGLFGLPPNGADGKLSSGGAGGASATFQCAIEVRPEDLLPVADRDTALEYVRHKLLPRRESPAMTLLVKALRDPRAKGLLLRCVARRDDGDPRDPHALRRPECKRVPRAIQQDAAAGSARSTLGARELLQAFGIEPPG